MSPNVAASVKARLLNRAKAQREEFERTLVRYAGERWLYRLSVSSARERCVLKGASLLAIWLSDPYRATRDLDLLAFGANDEVAVRTLVEEVCAVPCPEDGLAFDTGGARVDEIRSAEEYVGRRVRFDALLERARIRVQVDIGFGDALAVPPEEIVYPATLDDLPPGAPPRLSTRGQHCGKVPRHGVPRRAEQQDEGLPRHLRARWRVQLRRGRASAHDRSCFERRETPWSPETPPALTTAFYQSPELEERWRRYVRAGSVLIAPPGQFDVVGERIARFLGPIRESLVAATPFTREWLPGGAWR